MADNRFMEIVNTFARFGFGQLVRRNKEPEKDASQLRKSFEALGPTFIKIGQILSTRNDLLPDEYIEELKKLQNASPSFSYEEANEVFQASYGVPMEEAFIDPSIEPLATGSIAQVHTAYLPSGEKVAIKIQRPNIRKEMIRDLDLFIRLVNYLPNIFQEIIFDPESILTNLKEQTLDELNFYVEAQHMVKFSSLNKERSLIRAPHVYVKYCSDTILVQEFIAGLDLTQAEDLQAQGYDLIDITEKLVTSCLYQIFQDGFYHADVHPGNIMIYEGKLYFLDFGITGSLDPFQKKFLNHYLQALVMKDISALTELILLICKPRGEVDEVSLYRSINQMYDRYLSAGLAAFKFDEVLQETLKLAWKHNLTFPHEYVLLAKTVVMLQGIAQGLDPNMDFMGILLTFSQRSEVFNLKELADPKKIVEKTSRSLIAGLELPNVLKQFLESANKERLTVNLSLRHEDKILRELNQITNRVAISILLAAIIIASGLLTTSNASERTTTIGLFFFIIGVVCALYLLFSFYRSRK